MAVDLLSIFRIKTDVIDRLPIQSSTSNQSILSSEFQSFNNEHHFIPLGFRNRMHQWRKIGFQRKYARNFCWLFINVTSWSCNHKNHHQTKLHQNIWTIRRPVLLRRKLILKLGILVADWRRLESLAPIGRAKENLASIWIIV